MSYHIDLALQKAEEAERGGDKKGAEKWYAIAEKYEELLKKQEEKNNKGEF